MQLTRREFLAATAATSAAAVFRPSLALPSAEATFYQWTEVSPGMWCGQTRTADNVLVVGGNTLLIPHGEGALLVDAMQAVLAPSLKREALTKTKKIATVINTHHHFDHAGGNHAFTADSAVHAHPKCRERLLKDFKGQIAQVDQRIAALEALEIDGAKAAAADAKAFKDSLATLKPEAFAPTHTIDKVEATMELAGRKVEVRHIGAGHTDNDLFLFFPKENVLVTGDLVFNNYFPFFDPSASADSEGWQKSLRAALKQCNEKTVVIPGHGEITDRGAIQRQIEYFDTIRGAVSKAMKEGKTREDVVKMEFPQFASYKLKGASGTSLGGVYDELNRK
ncbi:MAG: MBL fold metallo-hydrolase [Planctomycetes bacterium]|nr:MBL fold metallo-hydrolase [Planctomycetota bacterium]